MSRDQTVAGARCIAPSSRRCPLCDSEHVLTTHALEWTVFACRNCLGLVKVIWNPEDDGDSTGRIEVLLAPVTKSTLH
jgi:hypothetical protein